MRAALRVTGGMDLGVPATYGVADTMGQGHPFPPLAQRWTLMQLGTPNNPSVIRLKVIHCA